jgi:hypothetical protein
VSKAGRPRREIDWPQFEKLCGIHCTLPEMAAWFQCSEDTIERAVKRQYGENFAEIYRQKQGLGKVSLRRKMFETAMNGSVTMMIWLSKNMLGYTDKVEQKTELSGSQRFQLDEPSLDRAIELELKLLDASKK